MRLTLHKHMSNHDLAELFAFIAGVVAMSDANRFTSRAYQNVATVIDQYPQELRHMFLSNPNFDQIPGIGIAINKKLQELFLAGNIESFQTYVEHVPAGAWPLTKVQGLGVKKAMQLAQEFKLDNEATALADLLVQANAGKIQELPGWGEKSEKDLITALTQYFSSGRLPYNTAKQIADALVAKLKKCPAIQQVEVLGSLRRQNPTVGDIDIGLTTDDFNQVKTFVKSMENVKRVIASGEQVIRITVETKAHHPASTATHAQGPAPTHPAEFQVDLKTVPQAEWGSFLQHYTGSKEHNIKLREFALKQGKSLSEHGIKMISPAQTLKFDSESEFYAYLGLAWIPPKERVGGNEIARHQLKNHKT